jgi:RecA-family ATPase
MNPLPEPPDFPQWDDDKPATKTKLPTPLYELPLGKLASELFQREKTPSDFVLPGFIAGTLGALIAPGSTGKSMLAMQLAALVAGANMIGTDWPELKVGDVLILAVEDPENELYNRWTDLGSRMSPEEREAGKRVRVIPMIGQRFDIMNNEHFEALMRACSGKRLLILDTMRRIHTLDENDGGAMAQVVGRLEEIAAATGCAILFLHHTNKAATFNASGDQQQASRGSSVLVDNIRFQMFMVSMNEQDKASKEVQKELHNRFVRVGVSKVNYGPKIGDIWLHRTDGGILEPAEFPTSSITSIEKTTRKKKNSAKGVNGGNW